MVDRCLQRTNRDTIYDFIKFSVRPARRKREFFRDLYLKEGLSAAQIAERVGLSKTAVLERLRAQGIRNLPDRRASPGNYRAPEPPYGFTKRDGKLVPCRTELKICRLVVQMYEEERRTYSAIGRELMQRGYRNRRGEMRWTHGTISRIYRRWKGKL